MDSSKGSEMIVKPIWKKTIKKLYIKPQPLHMEKSSKNQKNMNWIQDKGRHGGNRH